MQTLCRLPGLFLAGLMLAAPTRMAAWWSYGVPSNNNVGINVSGDVDLAAIRPGSTVPVYVNAGTEGGQWWQLEYIYINGATVITHPGSTGFGGWLGFTAPSTPGNYTAYFWCKDGRGVESYWLGLNYTVTNAAPTVDWHTLPPSPLYVGSWFPVRATGVDTDENLAGVWVEFSENGGAWQGLAYDPAGVNGGSRGATTSNNNGLTAGPPGTTYKFRCYAYDLAGDSSGWRESSVYTVADRPPSVTLAAAGLGSVNGGGRIDVSVANGTTINFTSTASDLDGNFARIRAWVNFNNQGWVVVRDDASAGYNWSYPLTGLGTYQFHSRSIDSSGVESDTAIINIAANNRPPSVTHQLLDAAKNALPINDGGRAQIYGNQIFYIRVSGTDPDSNLIRLYSRINNAAGAGFAYEDAAASGGVASHDFGPYNTGGSFGVWDVWTQAQDGAGGASVWQGGSWWGAQSPDLEVVNRPPAVILVADGLATVAGGSQVDASIANGSTVHFTSTASDSDGNYARTRTWVNYNNQGWVLVREDANPGYSWTYALNGLGTYQFHSRSIDSLDLESPTAILNVTTANRTPGTVSVAIPSLFATSATVSFSAADPDANLRSLLVHYRNATTGSAWRILRVGDTTADYAWNTALPSSADSGAIGLNAAGTAGSLTASRVWAPDLGAGQYEIHARAIDAAGAASWASLLFTLVNMPSATIAASVPRTTASTAGGGAALAVVAGDVVTVTSTAAASGGYLNEHAILAYSGTTTPSGLGRLVTTAPGGTPAATASALSTIWTAPNVPGAYTLYAEAFTGIGGSAGDRVGGTSGYPGYFDGGADKRITVNVRANTAPTAGISAGASTVALGETVSLTINGADADGNLRRVNVWMHLPGSDPATDPGQNIRANGSLAPAYSEDEPTTNALYAASNTGALGPLTLAFKFELGQPTGTYRFEVRAKDSFGQNSPPQNVWVTLTRATPVVTWQTPAPIVYGTALSGAQLNAAATASGSTMPLAGSYSYFPAMGTVLPVPTNGDPQILTVTFTPSDTANYATVVKSVPLTIAKAPLTVKAQDASRIFGAENPAFAPAYSGFVNGDTPAAVTGSATFATSAGASSDVGAYAIVPALGTLSAANYSLVLAPGTQAHGTLTIAPKPLDLTFDPRNFIYDPSVVQRPLPTPNVAYEMVAGGTDHVATGSYGAYYFRARATGNYTSAWVDVYWNIICCTADVEVDPASLVHTYDGQPKQALASTRNPSGLNVAITYAGSTVLPVLAGAYPVKAIVSDEPDEHGRQWGGEKTGLALTINQAAQTPLTVSAPQSSMGYGASQLLSTSGGSGNGTVSYEIVSQNPSSGSLATISGNVLTANAATGSVTLRAIKASGTDGKDDQGNYLPATSTNTVTVAFGKADQAPLVFNPTSPIAFGDPPAVLSASGGSGAGAFVFSIAGQDPTARADAATLVSTAMGPALQPNTGTGWVDVRATRGGDDQYKPISLVARVNLAKGTPPVTWTNPANIVYGTRLGDTQLNADANGILGTLVYSRAAGTLLSAGEHELRVTFTPTGPAAIDYNELTKEVRIEVFKADPVVTWYTPADITFGMALSDAQLNATADVPGTFAYSPGFGTKLSAGNRTLSATFTPTDTTNYNTVEDIVRHLQVAKAVPMLAWAPPAPIVFGTLLSATQLCATADSDGTFFYEPPENYLLLAGSDQPLRVTFAPADSANYETASATVALTVIKATPVVAWATPEPIVYGTTLSNAQLNAAARIGAANLPGAFVYTPVLGTRLNAGDHRLDVAFTPEDADNYDSAVGSVTLQVRKADPVIEWAQPAEIVYGAALSGAQLNAAANVPGTFAYDPGVGTILDAGNRTLSALFTPADTANYNPVSRSVVLSIAKAPQAALVLQAITPQRMGVPQTLSVAGGSGDGEVHYTVAAQSEPANASLDGSRFVPGKGYGWADVRAAKDGSTNYLPATSDPVRIAFQKGLAAVSLGNLTHTYNGSVKSASVVTVPGGLAVNVTYDNGSATPPVNAGDHSVTATVNDLNYEGAATATLTILRAPQTVSVSPSSPTIVFGESVTLTASGGQNGYVWGGAAAGSSAAVTFSPDRAGVSTATVYSPEGGNHERSPDRTVEIGVSKATPNGVFASKVHDAPYAVTPADLNATFVNPYNNAAAPSAVSYVTDTGIMLIPGVPLTPGSYTVTATYPGDANYTSATATATFTIRKITPTITWSPGAISYGAAFGAAQLNASAGGVAGSFTYTPSAGTRATAAGSQALFANFTPSDTSSYNDATQSVTITVDKANQTIALNPDPLPARTYGGPALNLEATASSGLPVAISVSNPGALAGPVAASTANGISKARAAVRSQGAGTVTLTATQPGDANYHAATQVVRTYTVEKATQTIRFDHPGDRVVGSTFDLGATATSGLPVTYTSSDDAILSVSGSTATVNAVGGITITAHQTGDANYEAAPDVAQAFNAATHGWLVKPPAIAMAGTNAQFKYRAGRFGGPLPYPPYSGSIDPLFYYKAPGATTWTACGGPDSVLSQGLPAGEYVVFGTVTFSARGHYDIALAPIGASGAATLPTGFSPGSTVVGVEVKDAQTIAFPALQPLYVFNQTITLGASSDSGLPVSYAVVGPATLAGSALQFTGPGQVTVTASQAGDANYAPATSVSQTVEVVAAPVVVLEPVIAPANGGGSVTGSGYALDYWDGAPVNVVLLIDGTEFPLTRNLPRPDVQALALAGLVRSGAPSANAGVSFAIPSSSLPPTADGNHVLRLVATNTKEISATSASVIFNGTQNGQTITVAEVGLKSLGAAPFDLVATASSGQPVSFAVLEGPVSLSGARNERVTLGARGGEVKIRATAPATATFAAASVDFSFVVGDRDDMNGNGISDRWEQRFGLIGAKAVNANSDFNHDDILDVDEYALWRDPTADTSHLEADERVWSAQAGQVVATIDSQIYANGPGTVTVAQHGESSTFTFAGAADGAWRPISGASGSGGGLTYALKDGVDDVRTVTSSSGASNWNYVILVRPDPLNARVRPRQIVINDRFVEGVNRQDIEVANHHVLRVRAQSGALLPFGAADLSALDTTRTIQLGLGADPSGRPVGSLTFNAGSHVNGVVDPLNPYGNLAAGGTAGLSFYPGPANRGLLMRPNRPTHFQVISPDGYIDVQRSRWTSKISYYANGTYARTVDNFLYDFGATPPLVCYTFEMDTPGAPAAADCPSTVFKTFTPADFQGALAIRMTRTAGGDVKLFEFLTRWFKAGGTGALIDAGPRYRGYAHPDYLATVTRQWAARSPSAPRGSLTEVTFEATQPVVMINSVTSYRAYQSIQLKKRKYADDTNGSTLLYYENLGFAKGDEGLQNAPASRWTGLGADGHSEGGNATITNPVGDAIAGTLELSPTGGQVFTENYWNNLNSSRYGTQPWLALNKPRQRRQAFLDDAVANHLSYPEIAAGHATDLVTHYGYGQDFYDGRLRVSQEETTQNGVVIGHTSYAYAEGMIGPNATLDSTLTASASAGVALVTFNRNYSSRLDDLAFRGRPAATRRPDGTKTSYAYQLGTWSSGSWTAQPSGPHLLVAELSGKVGTTLSSYRAVEVDSLDLDPNHSTATEKIFDASSRLVGEAAWLYTGGTSFQPLSSVTYTYDGLGNLTTKTTDNGRVLYTASYTGFRKDWEIDEQGIKLTYAYDPYDRVWTMTRASATDPGSGNTITATTTTYHYDEIGRLKTETLSAPGTNEQLVTSYTYDTARRPKSTTAPGGARPLAANLIDGATTSISYDSPTQTTTTLPGGGTKIVQLYVDGRAKSVGGTAVADSSTAYTYAPGGNLQTIATTAGQSAMTETDWLGRPLSATTATWGNGTVPAQIDVVFSATLRS